MEMPCSCMRLEAIQDVGQVLTLLAALLAPLIPVVIADGAIEREAVGRPPRMKHQSEKCIKFL